MNYKQSPEILKEIEKASTIGLNCHVSPDPDSVGSALSLYCLLTTMGKKVRVLSSSPLPKNLKFMPFYDVIEVIDPLTLDLSTIDLFMAADSSTWAYAIGNPGVEKPEKLVVIDHHKNNSGYGNINLIDAKAASLGEVLYRVFEDWKVVIDKNIATNLLTGILSDTGVFRFPATTSETLKIAGSLMSKGVDKDEIIFHIFWSTDIKLMRLWGVALSGLEVDKKGNFAWVAIDYETFERFGKPSSAKESFATLFLQSVKDTDFGIVMIEQVKGELGISLRSRTGIDVSKIAVELGGGGHIWAAGASVKDLPFDEATKKVLNMARKLAVS